MLRFFISIFIISIFPSFAIAEQARPVPEKWLVYSKDVDFFGSDLSNLFDTSIEACERACLSNDQCAAFTFNQNSNSCFPKSGVTETETYEGAMSARVFSASPAAQDIGAARASELGFLGTADMSGALDQAKTLGRIHPGGKWTVQVLLDAARDLENEGNLTRALHWTGAATAQSNESSLWMDYARLAFQIKGKNSRETRNFKKRALLASINGYLRASSVPAQVSALDVMSKALEATGRGRDMVSALRLATTLQPRDEMLAALDAAIAKYGFRVTGHTVENDSAAPRICAEFSENLVKVGTDYSPFVRLPDQSLVVQANGTQICIDGVTHGTRYQVTFRSGLPAASGEVLSKDVPLTLYVGDRTPKVRFPGRSYVLPKSSDAALPIETVNLDTVDLLLRRVSDRNLLRAMQDDLFARPLSYYEDESFKTKIGEEIWTGEGSVENTLNQDMTTRLPMGEIIGELPAGIYALTARVPGADVFEDAGATQWFILSDIGLSTLQGDDGVHVFARGLSDASALENVSISLLSRANSVLATAETDAQGYVRFPAGTTRGTGASAPALVLAKRGDEDLAFLSLTDPAFDLSDRGVEGRAPSGPMDVFVYTDRGAYRAGEVIHATALVRDATSKAIGDMPLTAILTRPDGVEYQRSVSTEDRAGGHSFAMPIADSAPRGTWTLAFKVDPDAPALSQTQVLVEDFLPERIDFDIDLTAGEIRLGDRPTAAVDARYLFGAPAPDLPIEGTVRVSAIDALEGYPGVQFGRYDAPFYAKSNFLGESSRTDVSGKATVMLALPDIKDPGIPLEMTAILRVSEGSGRPVERVVKRALAPSGPMIGIKPLFDGVVSEGTDATLEIIAIDSELQQMPMQVRWTLNRVETRYQWYQQYGNWDWEPITTRKRIATEVADLSGPLTVTAPVDWGRYELVVERLDGTYVSASRDFYAGWYAPADASATPDTLELSLDKPGYRSGETAQLRIVPRYAGQALVTVMSGHVIHMETVAVTEGENLIPLAVTDEWGAGAYVTASVIRPMDVATGQNPARAIGLSYAVIDPGVRQLAVTLDAPSEIDPRGPLTITANVDGIATGDTAFVTVAAVDLGILNLTQFKTPDPSGHYFGQRRLGMELRDVYGRLINGMNGAMGQVRSGGDAASRMRLQSPPPTQELVAYFSGVTTVGPDGTAQISFDIPQFNGTVRLMAVAWSTEGVGQAETDVLVRDPVVVTASLPRFLAPGDESRMLLEITHATGPSGRMGLDVTADGIRLDAASIPPGLTLADLGSAKFEIPIRAGDVGNHPLRIALTTPDGKQLVQTLTLPVRANDPQISETRRFNLAPNSEFTLSDDVFAGLKSGTASATITAGPFAKLDAPGLLHTLDQYPYGCTEQITSKALPLLYFDEVAQAMGMAETATVQTRIDQAIAKILTRQSSGGAFGLWRAGSGDFWLDAYVTDFLSRAKAKGYAVPQRAFRVALDNLRNRINYAPDFDDGGEDIAYALMVLAREGAAAMGDLRYYADVKAEAFGTPLALAQLAGALASYGDQTRADALFMYAVRRMMFRMGDEAREWRADYGTNLRDAAGLITLAAEAGSQGVNTAALADHISRSTNRMSTQEASWSLLAAHAMIQDGTQSGLNLDGAPLTGPFIRRVTQGMDAAVLTNTSTRDTDITLTTYGVPTVAPDAGGYGYQIERKYLTMDGALHTGPVAAGDRFVAVITVRPFEKGSSRLMIDDPLPAGFEIDNPNLLRGGDIRALDWLETVDTLTAEFRSDRFLAAVDWHSTEPFNLAYVVRAVSPGTYHHPAAAVEDMYRPQYRARTETGALIVTK